MRRLSQLSAPGAALAATAALASSAAGYLIFRNGGWVYDDNLLLVLARQAGFTWKWLDHPVFQHWDIAMNAAYAGMVDLFPLDYRWGLLAMVAVLGAAIWVFARVLALLGVRGWASVAAAVWFGLSILWSRQLQWWAAGVQELPALLCDLICLYAFLRFSADARRRWILISTAALAVGLLFYEKPALMVVYLALARALLMSDTLAPRAIAATFWRERRLWLSYGAVIAVWGYGYLSSGALSSVGSGHVGIGQYGSYFRIMWINTLAPALAGFTLPAANLSAWQAIAAAAIQLLFLCLLVASVHRQRGAWRAWLFFAATVVIDGLLVARTRIGLFGAGIGNDLRYLTDFGWLLPLTLCAAFGGDRVLRPAPASVGARIPRRPLRSALPVAITALLVAYSAGAVLTATHLQTGWDSIKARHWEANVERGFAALAREHLRPVVADQQVPFQIISSAFAPYNRLSYVLPLYANGFDIGGPVAGPLVMVDAQGHVDRATIVASAATAGAPRLLHAGRLRVRGAAVRVRVRDVCVAAGGSNAQVQWRPATAPRGSGPYYLDLHYTTSEPAELSILQDAGSGFGTSTPRTIIIAAYAHASLAWLDAGAPRRLELVIPAHTDFCLRRIDVVMLRSAAA